MNVKEFFSTYKKHLIIGGSVTTAVVVGAIVAFMIFGKHKDSYVNVIPKNACVMMRIDPKALFYDNDIKIGELLSKAHLDEEDIKESGIDFSGSVYFFMSKDVQAGLVAKVRDKDKAKEFVEDHWDKLGMGKSKSLSERDDMYYAARYDNCICIDDDKIMLVEFSHKAGDFEEDGVEASRKGRNLMEQEKDASVYDKPIYEEILDSKKPVALNFDFSNLPDRVKENMDEAANVDAVKALMGSHMLMTFGIEEDAATLSVDFLPQTDKAKSIYEKQEKNFSKIKGDLLGYGTKAPIAWATASIDGSKFASQIAENDIIKNAMRELPSGINLESILASFNGDCVVSVDVMKKDNSPEPLIFVAAKTKDNSLYNAIPKLFENNGHVIVKNQGSEYQFFKNNSYGYDSYGGYNSYNNGYNSYNNTFDVDTVAVAAVADSVATEEDYATAAPQPDPSQAPLFVVGNKDGILYGTNGTASELLKANCKTLVDNKSEIIDCIIYAVVNIQGIIKNIEEYAKDNAIASTIAKYLKPFDYVVFKWSTMTHGECVLRTRDKKTISETINSWL